MIRRPTGSVHLNRALSKLGVLTRSQATEAILDGRVRVGGRIVTDPAAPVMLSRDRIVVDDRRADAEPWRTILFHKPRGVVTTRRDPAGRRTVYDALEGQGHGLVPVGRLDLATSGLLLMTSDRTFADWITDPAHHVPRTYIVTVRGSVSAETTARLKEGIVDRGERLRPRDLVVRKRSARESHLTIVLDEGKNREVRRLCAAVGHEVTRLARVRLGALELGTLQPGRWRELDRREVLRAFPGCRLRDED